jgi:hypothetical protein
MDASQNAVLTWFRISRLFQFSEPLIGFNSTQLPFAEASAISARVIAGGSGLARYQKAPAGLIELREKSMPIYSNQTRSLAVDFKS